MADIVNVHVTQAKTFLVRCPQCGHGSDVPAPATDAKVENPFPFTCRCGRELSVLMNYRRRARKPVHLQGAVTFAPSTTMEVCTVDDISVGGLSLSVYPPSAAGPGAKVVVKLVLNDPQKSRLTLAGVVRRVSRTGARIVCGVELGKLTDYESQVLSFYLM